MTLGTARLKHAYRPGGELPKARGNSTDNQQSRHTEEEDVSETWNDQKRQQAVETLLGSCAGSDYTESAEPPQVMSQSRI